VDPEPEEEEAVRLPVAGRRVVVVVVVVVGTGAGDVLSELLSPSADALEVAVSRGAHWVVGSGIRRAGAEVGVATGRRRLGARTSETKC